MKVFHSNKVVLKDGIAASWVYVEHGKIQQIDSNPPLRSDIPVEELGDLVLMPGGVDPHVHINEPGRAEWEGFHTATQAALAGGITSLVEMPLNASPVTTTPAALHEKITAAQKNLHVHVGFWGGIVPGNTDQLEGMIRDGVLGFKAFLTHSGIDDFPNATEADLDIAMPVLAKYKMPLLVHCELSDDLARGTGDPLSYQNYLSSRPRSWENDAIAMIIRLCEKHNCPVHVVHLSSADAIPMLLEARRKGLPVSVETAQHYLYFNAEDIPDARPEYKCAPPIREKENNDALWKGLKDGVIDFVATDHSPATPDLKELHSGNYMKAWGGIASLQLALPVLWTAAEQRGMNLNNLVRWLCTHPAKMAGLSHAKGAIAVGMDADFAVIDPDRSFVVDAAQLFHKHKITPYHGEKLKGLVRQTWIKGEKVYEDGKILLYNQGNILKPGISK